MTRVRSWRGVIGSGSVLLAAYLLFLVALAPATLLDTGLDRATDGRLRMVQAHGTLWSGAAQMEIRNRDGQRVAGKPLAWTLQPGGLWRGRLDYAVAIDHAAKPFPLHLSRRGVDLAGVDFALPARVLGVVVPRLAPLGPQGELALHVTRLVLADGEIAADGVATWRDASSALSAVAPLGTYELRFKRGHGPEQVTLRTLSGSLQLEGTGTWRDGALTLAPTARVASRHRAQLAPLLRLVAVERGDGTFVLPLRPPLGTSASGQNLGGSPAREPDAARGHPISAARGE